jgi:hypothetical protein
LILENAFQLHFNQGLYSRTFISNDGIFLIYQFLLQQPTSPEEAFSLSDEVWQAQSVA